jgi:hypothetical protein
MVCELLEGGRGGGDLMDERAEDGPDDVEDGRLGNCGGTVWFLRARAFSKSRVIVGGLITGEADADTFS